VIEVRDLTKWYGGTTAVDRLSFEARPGLVTGFVGPNGSGKSTTLRVILGLDHPTAGGATVDGRAYADLPAPVEAVGALLDAGAADRARTADDHLRWVARAARLPRRRIDQVLDLVGLGRSPAGGCGPSRWGCPSASGSPPRCSATRGR
jgi:ABC-2 type transport system ATP-binding protein